jgi:type I restriction enzyme S subunit
MDGEFNIAEWKSEEALLNQRVCKIIPKGILQGYLLWYLPIVLKKIEDTTSFVTVKHLSSRQLHQIPIPIPPLPEQERIVSELDCINGILEKKREQIKELDALAQSIFYHMFGDPVTNEKGWEVKKLGEVCDVRDGTHDSPKYLEFSDYVLITSKNIVGDTIDFTSANYISEEDYTNINKRSCVDEGDIIMAMIGTIGKPIIVKKLDRNFCIKNVALIKFVNSLEVTNVYIRALLNDEIYSKYIQGQNKGGTQKFIALGTIRKLNIPLPPLSLQQSFATKIAAIEKQKELIKRSIAEVETLLASRMQLYFG